MSSNDEFNYTVEADVPTPKPAMDEHRVVSVTAKNVTEAEERALAQLPEGARITRSMMTGIARPES